MWLDNLSIELRAVGQFAQFLLSPQYLARVQAQQDALSLMDALQAWLEDGDGLDTCLTFESFLIVVVATIDEWLTSDCKRIIDSPVFPPRPDLVVYLFNPLETKLSSPMHHPVMLRANFEMLMAQLHIERRAELCGQITRLAERLDN